MKLDAPIYHLKRRAKALAKQQGIPLNRALDTIAQEQGYARWSLLAARQSSSETPQEALDRLQPGDLLLLGARPQQGKTLFSLHLIVEAIERNQSAAFFTLEYNQQQFVAQLNAIGANLAKLHDRMIFDCSDAICAEYIIDQMSAAPKGTLIVIDYLQLLDQKRENAHLEDQVAALRTFARQKGLIIVFISQISRNFELSGKACPDLEDVRLPNPVDLSLFTKTCFINAGHVQFATM